MLSLRVKFIFLLSSILCQWGPVLHVCSHNILKSNMALKPQHKTDNVVTKQHGDWLKLWQGLDNHKSYSNKICRQEHGLLCLTILTTTGFEMRTKGHTCTWHLIKKASQLQCTLNHIKHYFNTSMPTSHYRFIEFWIKLSMEKEETRLVCFIHLCN